MSSPTDESEQSSQPAESTKKFEESNKMYVDNANDCEDDQNMANSKLKNFLIDSDKTPEQQPTVVKIKKSDIDTIMKNFNISKYHAEKFLRENNGNLLACGEFLMKNFSFY